jgi:zinc protease
VIPEVHRHLVDGVPVLSADSPADRSGAMLVFRVGRFDETLPASGITHLIEHLALAGPDRPTYHFNAEVRGRFTTFFMESAVASDVADFVARVCAGLDADHSSRLEQEKRVLRTEAASRGSPGALGSCLVERYGATGPGLAGYEEYGLRKLAWEQVAAWRARWFVAGNAVLCVTGALPSGLRIPLTPGRAPGLPAVRPSAARLPGFIVNGRGGIGMSLAGRMSLASSVTLDLLQRRLTNELRHDRGLSYGVVGSAERIDADLRHAWVAADALPEQAAMAAHVMLGTFEKLAEGGGTAEEIAEYSRRLRDAYQSPAGPMLVMLRHAENILTARPVRAPGETLRQAAELTGSDVGAAAAGLYASMVVATPKFLPAVQGRMPQLPQWSATELEGGISYRSRGGAQKLTVGERGVMLTAEPGRFVTVPSDEVAALLKWNDAKLTLIGTDGFGVQIDPAEWDDADDAIRALEAGTDPGLIVAIDAPGPAGKKPAVPPAAAAADGPASRAKRRRAWRWLFWLVAAAWLACLVGAVLYKNAVVAFGVWLGAVFTASTLLRRARLRVRARRALRAARAGQPSRPGSTEDYG